MVATLVHFWVRLLLQLKYIIAILLSLSIYTSCTYPWKTNINAAMSLPTVQQPVHQTLTGHIPADQVLTFVFAKFQVPVGTTRIQVRQNYSNQGNGNSLDLGCWDQRGYDLALSGNFTTGFRGWSGGARSYFSISPTEATPGYIPGSIEPGQWYVALGPYKSVPEGIDYELHIELSFDPVASYFQPDFAPHSLSIGSAQKISTSNTLGSWYRGDLHMHTIYSDGRHTPAEIIEFAETAKLDFIFSTDHNTQSSGLIWGSVAPNTMLVGQGIEVTTRYGHWGAIGLNWYEWVEFRYSPMDTPGLSEAVGKVHQGGGFAIANHPFTIIDCLGCNWQFPYDDMDGIEVWNGEWDSTDNEAVQKWHDLLVHGSRIIAVGGSDFHRVADDCVGLPTTVVRAGKLSVPAILDSLRAGHAYIVHGVGMSMDFSIIIDGSIRAEVGDRINQKGPLIAKLWTEGMDSGKAMFISADRIFHEEVIITGQEIHLVLPAVGWVRVEVRDSAGKMLGMTNPIWIEKGSL